MAEELRDKVARVFAANPEMTDAQRVAVVNRLRERQAAPQPEAAEEGPSFLQRTAGLVGEAFREGTAPELLGQVAAAPAKRLRSAAVGTIGALPESIQTRGALAASSALENLREAQENLREAQEQTAGRFLHAEEAITGLTPEKVIPEVIEAGRAEGLGGAAKAGLGAGLGAVLGTADIPFAPFSESVRAVSRQAHGLSPAEFKSAAEKARVARDAKFKRIREALKEEPADTDAPSMLSLVTDAMVGMDIDPEQARAAQEAASAMANPKRSAAQAELDAVNKELTDMGSLGVVDIDNPGGVAGNPFIGLTKDELEALGPDVASAARAEYDATVAEGLLPMAKTGVKGLPDVPPRGTRKALAASKQAIEGAEAAAAEKAAAMAAEPTAERAARFIGKGEARKPPVKPWPPQKRPDLEGNIAKFAGERPKPAEGRSLVSAARSARRAKRTAEAAAKRKSIAEIETPAGAVEAPPKFAKVKGRVRVRPSAGKPAPKTPKAQPAVRQQRWLHEPEGGGKRPRIGKRIRQERPVTPKQARAEFEADLQYLHGGAKSTKKRGLLTAAQVLAKKRTREGVFAQKMRQFGVGEDQLEGIMKTRGVTDPKKLSTSDMLEMVGDAAAGKYGKIKAPRAPVSRDEAIAQVSNWQQLTKDVTHRQMRSIVERATGKVVPREVRWEKWAKKNLSDDELADLVEFVGGKFSRATGLVNSGTGPRKRLKIRRVENDLGGPESVLTPAEVRALAEAKPKTTAIGRWWLAEPSFRGTPAWEFMNKGSERAARFLRESFEEILPDIRALSKRHKGKARLGALRKSVRQGFKDELHKVSDVLEGKRPPTDLSPEGARLAAKMRASYDRAHELLGLPKWQYRKNYLPWQRAKKLVKEHGPNWEQEWPKDLAEDAKFFAEFERSAQQLAGTDLERNAAVLFELYMRGAAKRLYLDPMKQALLHPQDPSYLRALGRSTELIREQEKLARLGRSLSKENAAELFKLQSEMVKKEAQLALRFPRMDPQQALTYGAFGKGSRAVSADVHKLVNEVYLPDLMGTANSRDLRWSGLANKTLGMVREAGHAVHWQGMEQWAASRMGLKAARSATRAMMNLTYTAALGGRLKSGIKNLTQTISTIGEIGPRWTAAGIGKLLNTDTRRQMIALAKENDVFTGFAPGLESELKLFSSAWEKFKSGSMAWFSGTDRANRMIAFTGGHEAMLHAMKKGPKHVEGLMRFVDIPSTHLEIMSLVKAGSSAKAAARFGKWISDSTQWAYTAASRPNVARGPFGALAGQFTTWPMHWQHLLRRWAFGGEHKPKEMAKFFMKHGWKRYARYTATTTAATYAAKELLGVELDSWLPWNPAAHIMKMALRQMDIEPNDIPILKEIKTGNTSPWDPGIYSETPWPKVALAAGTMLKGMLESHLDGSKFGKLTERDMKDAAKTLENSTWMFIPVGLLLRDIQRFGRTSGILPESYGGAAPGQEWELTAAYPRSQQQQAKAVGKGLGLRPDISKARAVPSLLTGATLQIPVNATLKVSPAQYFKDRFLAPDIDIAEAYRVGDEIEEQKLTDLSDGYGEAMLMLNNALGGAL
ncbi:MAG: hypothetical protein GY700_06405 [Propionibacteriaceae bacterium]|nr:hypothetical protein [Propionibacteriaceae bacterium]